MAADAPGRVSGAGTDRAAVGRVAARFGWVPRSISPIRHGHINTSYIVSTPAGDYVLQRLNGAVLTDVEGMMSNILVLHRHLGGELVPAPVAAPGGSWLVHDGSDVWRAFERVAGAAPLPEVTPAGAREAGQLLGRFHARVAGLDPSALAETLPGFHDPARRLEALRHVVEADPHRRVAAVREEIDQALAAEPLVAVAEDLTHRAPRRVAHNDAKLDNVLFREGRAVCLVDLDTVMPGRWFWDVGDLLRTAATSAPEDGPEPERAVVDPLLYDAVLDGYRLAVSQGPVERAELESLEAAGAIVTYEQALRFLTDWLAGDVYYRTTRPGQNRDRARTQLHLLASMPGAPR